MRSELLERDDELTLLASAMQEPAGRLVVVAGRAGVGKTRLLGEAAILAGQAGMRVVPARGVELEREFAFGLVRQLFDPVLAAADPELRARLLEGPASLAGEMLGFPPPRRSGNALLGKAGEFARLNALWWLLVNICREGPLLAVVDDAHWADVSSLRFLAYVLPRMRSLNLVLVVCVRPNEPGAELRLLDFIMTDPIAEVLRLRPLTQPASARFLTAALGEADPAFLDACYEATSGNPLLLRELAAVLSADGVAATRENIPQVMEIGPRAVAHWVGRRLGSLPPELRTFAGAAALLGEDATVTEVARLAWLDGATGAAAAKELDRIEILRMTFDPARGSGETRVRFVHPLIRSAVYDQLGPVEQDFGHGRAARMLAADGVASERVAAHLLATLPRADPHVVASLRSAAAAAAAQGSPETAVTYLGRCLAEPPDGPQETLEILIEAGTLAQRVDLPACSRFLSRAHDLATELAIDASQRAEIAQQLMTALMFSGSLPRGQQLLVDVIGSLPDDLTDYRYRAQAWLVVLHATGMSARAELSGIDLAALYALEPDSSLGGRMLDCALSHADTRHGNPAAVSRARRGLKDDLLMDASWMFSSSAWYALSRADADDLPELLEHALHLARQSGDLVGLGFIYAYQGGGWLRCGQLAEAESVLSEAIRMIEVTAIDQFRTLVCPWLAEALIEQGRLEEAGAALERAGLPDAPPLINLMSDYLAAKARLKHLTGDPEEALRIALDSGAQLRACGADNPAVFAWRSQAALCLRELGRYEQARAHALDQLPLARTWGTPRVTGHALRIAGLMTDGEDGVRMLREAVTVLAGSPAVLEHAKALADLGAMLRRSGRRSMARAPLEQSLRLALRCGAAPLADYARAELAAAGGGPDELARTTPTGLDRLTPSELRVAQLAAGGDTNRQIAQKLYVTLKTVEVHLSSVYRKLDLTSRSQLAQTLDRLRH
jgi:DNA-binding CsgD family transcriptional regulator